MTAAAANWVWANSRAANGSLIVLLAIADECGKEGIAEMKVAEIGRKARLSDRAVQIAVRDLTALGEISVAIKAGAGGRNRYALCMKGGAESAPPSKSGQNRHSAGSSQDSEHVGGADSAPGVQNLHPAESAPPNRTTARSAPEGAESAPPEIPDALKGSVVSGDRSKPKRTSGTPRPDVDRLCEHLAGKVEDNGFRRPVITQRWKNDFRLLLDNDGVTEKQAHDAIDWCQQDSFWYKNIRSPEKLRKHYERLREDAKSERAKKNGSPRNSHQPTPEEFDALRDNWARPLDDKEAGNDPQGNDQPSGVHRDRLPAAEDKPGISGRLV